jgi:23S rRNA (cytosine1962-C5)-methyltransferase
MAMEQSNISSLLEKALSSHTHLFEEPYESAFRLFNGFYEGYPDLVLDVYGRTLLVHDHSDDPAGNSSTTEAVVAQVRDELDWLHAGILKTRNGISQAEKRGTLLFGEKPDHRIREHGIWYALDLTMNQDAGFYLDTSNLRKWLTENVRDRSVLNTFAYTGSLGVAATAGGASRVVQTDRGRSFLNLAKDSYALNGFPVHKADFIAGDFFPTVARFKATGQTFDCVILDPPFFSSTPKGRVDLVTKARG